MTEKQCKRSESDASDSENDSRPIPDDGIGRFAGRLKTLVQPSIRAFAKSCRLSEGTLRRYLEGDRYPTLDRLAAIAEAADVSAAWLATGERAAPPDKLGEQVGPYSTRGGDMFDPDVLRDVLISVERRLGGTLAPETKADLILDLARSMQISRDQNRAEALEMLKKRPSTYNE